MSHKKYFTSNPIVIIIGFAFAIFVGTMYALNTIPTGYRVDSGTPKVLDFRGTYGAGNYYQVSAPTGKSVFIPTKTLGEWNSVKTYAPARGIAVNACIDGGWSGETYWYTDDYGCNNYSYYYYTRSCTNPTPAYGGLGCVGSTTTTYSAYNGNCPVCAWDYNGTVAGPCGTPPSCSNYLTDAGNTYGCAWPTTITCVCQ